MTRTELNERIRKALGGTATPMAAALALDAVLRSIQEGLVEDGQVNLANFGQFELTQVSGRRFTNPRNQQQHCTQNHLKWKFKAARKQIIPLTH
ncbi:MAG: HU family DNA-binding protein [Akkermansia sp.]